MLTKKENVVQYLSTYIKVDIKVENILGKRRTKIEKNEDKIFIILQDLVTNISILSDHENKVALKNFVIEKLNIKVLFSFTIKFSIY